MKKTFEEKIFDLILVDPNQALCEAWQEKFKDFPAVSVHNDYFENIQAFDCMVSAANSFGLMDGGVDLAITNYFGREVQYRVQEVIKNEFFGEQPVGTSIIVETGHAKHPYIAHTPTMRVPLKITKTDNIYSAMFALLRAVALHNRKAERRINQVVCPGLGTSAGRVPPEEAARQMVLAYKNFYNPPPFFTWFHVLDRQKEIIFGGDMSASTS